jgi:hypothetical protein
MKLYPEYAPGIGIKGFLENYWKYYLPDIH